MRGKFRYYQATILHTFLIILIIINLFPLYFMASTSFRSERDYIFEPYSVPLRITFENFYELIVKYNFVRTILNSSIVTICSTIMGLVFSILAAFAFVTMKFPSKRTLLNLFVALIAVPPIVVLIPVYVFMVKVGLINTYPSAIIVYTGFIIPFSIFLLTGFFQSIPVSLIDAARLDGCGDFRILWKIFLPLSKAPIITLIIVNGLWVWNELLIALVFLQREEMRTLMTVIAFSQSRFSRNVPFIMTQSLIATIPPLVVYGISRRHLVRGFMGGITK